MNWTAEDFKWLVTLGSVALSALAMMKLTMQAGRVLERQDTHERRLSKVEEQCERTHRGHIRLAATLGESHDD